MLIHDGCGDRGAPGCQEAQDRHRGDNDTVVEYQDVDEQYLKSRGDNDRGRAVLKDGFQRRKVKEEPPDARGAEGIEEQVQDEIQREARRGGESGLPVEVVEDPHDLSTASNQSCDEGDYPVSPPAGG